MSEESVELFKVTFPTIQPEEDNVVFNGWPVVYFIYDNSSMYIGETACVKHRFNEHQISRIGEKGFRHAQIAYSDKFNKSAVYDLETKLLRLVSADSSNYALENIVLEQQSHNYYDKDFYLHEILPLLWNKLQKEGFAVGNLEDLENSNLFKYSPYTALTAEQIHVVKTVIAIILDFDHQDSYSHWDGDITTNATIRGTPSLNLVTGDPGTGKTLLVIKIAFDLVKKFGIDPREIAIIVPQKSARKTFKEIKASLGLRNMQVLSGTQFANLRKEDHFPRIVIVDEAHRLKKYFSKQAKDLKHLIKEDGGYFTELEIIADHSQHLVLMYDACQSVRPADISPEHVDELLDSHPNIYTNNLSSQQRIQGIEGYIECIKFALGLGAKDVEHSLDDPPTYDIRFYSSVEEMHRQIRVMDEKFGLSRMASGYYKEWKSKKDAALYDFDFDGYRLQWNRVDENWVFSKDSLDQVGCIHTLQGYDLNYCGVIVGDEVFFDSESQRIEIRPENFKDRNSTPNQRDHDYYEELRVNILSAYYVLMTRGIKGTFFYFEDSALATHFRESMKNSGFKISNWQ